MAVAVGGVGAGAGTRRGTWAARRRLAGVAFVLPAVAVVVVFFLVPLVLAAWVSLHEWSLFGGGSFVGFANYGAMLRDREFWASFWVTTRYVLLVTPPIFALGFALALLVNRERRGVGLFRTVFFLPNVVGFAAACLLWYFMVQDQFGVINAALRGLGLLEGSFLWLATADRALLLIVVMVVWKVAGGTMLLLLIGLQAIPGDLYEAAMIDGAGRWARLRSITLPLMKRTFALTLVLSVTGSYLAFEQFYILTRGGPRGQTTSLVFLVTSTAFVSFGVGYASTISIALLGLLVLFSAVQLYLLRDATQY